MVLVEWSVWDREIHPNPLGVHRHCGPQTAASDPQRTCRGRCVQESHLNRKEQDKDLNWKMLCRLTFIYELHYNIDLWTIKVKCQLKVKAPFFRPYWWPISWAHGVTLDCPVPWALWCSMDCCSTRQATNFVTCLFRHYIYKYFKLLGQLNLIYHYKKLQHFRTAWTKNINVAKIVGIFIFFSGNLADCFHT